MAVQFPGCKISFLLDKKLVRWSTTSCALALAYRPSLSKILMLISFQLVHLKFPKLLQIWCEGNKLKHWSNDNPKSTNMELSIWSCGGILRHEWYELTHPICHGSRSKKLEVLNTPWTLVWNSRLKPTLRFGLCNWLEYYLNLGLPGKICRKMLPH